MLLEAYPVRSVQAREPRLEFVMKLSMSLRGWQYE
jgi:hypothetical protein